MTYIWYVCDGEVEEYSGQEADWRSSVIVFAMSPEAALIKVMKYHQGMMERTGLMFNDRTIEVIS